MADMSLRDLAAAGVAVDLLTDINNKLIEYRAIKAGVASLAKAAADDRAACAKTLTEIATRQLAIEAVIGANVPAHEWQGTLLRLRNPDGTWGDRVDLKGYGDPGQPGQAGKAGTIEIASVEIGDPDALPQVVNTGTASAAVLHFVLPGIPVPALPLPPTYHYLGF